MRLVRGENRFQKIEWPSRDNGSRDFLQREEGGGKGPSRGLKDAANALEEKMILYFKKGGIKRRGSQEYCGETAGGEMKKKRGSRWPKGGGERENLRREDYHCKNDLTGSIVE